MASKTVRTTAITLGLASAITFSSVTVASARPQSDSSAASSASQKSHMMHSKPAPNGLKANVPSAPVSFSVTNVPANYTSAKQLARKLVFKVVRLSDSATSAPEVAPLPGKSAMAKGRGPVIDGNQKLTLSAGTLSGVIKLRASKTAGSVNYAIYPAVAADARTGLTAQKGAPVFVTVTTNSDLTTAITVQSSELVLDLSKNTGTLIQ